MPSDLPTDKGALYALAADIYTKHGFRDMWDIVHAHETRWEPDDPEDATTLRAIRAKVGDDFLMPGGWTFDSASHGGKREK